jgi:tripartite-type tricarboxylate transporter receptor subunit TctC
VKTDHQRLDAATGINMMMSMNLGGFPLHSSVCFASLRLITFRIIGIVLGAAALLGAGVAAGQNYPNKPVRLVTGEPGGPNDFVSRLIAAGLGDSLGQPVSVDNRGGAVVAGELVAKAAPDGHTLLAAGSTLWLLPFLRDRVAWDPLNDFLPVTLTSSAPNILAVHPSLPVKNVTGLLGLAKSRPGQLVSATGPAGSATFLATELLKAMAGVDIVRTIYQGNGPALRALIGGEAQLMFATSGAVTPHIKSGRLRALAVTSEKPSQLLPELPTVAASGLPGYESVAMTGIFAPAKTSGAIISRLNQEIARVLNTTDVRQRLFNSGVEVVASSPEQLTAKMKSEMARLGKVIREAGIRD